MTQETPSPIPASPVASKREDQNLRKIYFVSGLGADERIFQWLRYDGFQPVHIQWRAPERGEPIEGYAKRLSEQIEEDNPVIVGLSFGGMIAIEIAKQMNTQKIVLLSSVKETSEIPFYFKIFSTPPKARS
ncbi:MAG: alpha/beta hydrolase [Cyanobacteria bacterium J06555_13]